MDEDLAAIFHNAYVASCKSSLGSDLLNFADTMVYDAKATPQCAKWRVTAILSGLRAVTAAIKPTDVFGATPKLAPPLSKDAEIEQFRQRMSGVKSMKDL